MFQCYMRTPSLPPSLRFSPHPSLTYSLTPSLTCVSCVFFVFLFYGNRWNSSRRTGTEGFPLLPLRTCTLRSRGSRTRSTSEQTRANTRTCMPTWVNRLVCFAPPPPQPLGLYLRVLVGAYYANSRIVFFFQFFGTRLTGTQQPRCRALIHAS